LRAIYGISPIDNHVIIMPSVDYGNQYLKLVKELGGVLEGVVPLFSSRFSRRDYTLHQHVILLVLRAKERKPYRDFVAWLEVSETIVEALSLSKIPHYTTLQKAADRLPPGLLEKLVGVVGRLLVEDEYTAGVDGTGFSLDFSSRYYCKRIGRKDRHASYLKASIAGDMQSQAILSCRLRLKRRHDIVDFKPMLRKIRDTKPGVVVADRGYDSEDNLVFVKHELKAEPVIALTYREKPIKKTSGRLRRQLKQDFPTDEYRQRSKIETIISVVKRCYGSTIHSRKHRTKKNELYFKLIAYNCRRVINTIETLLTQGFLQSDLLHQLLIYV